MKIFILAGGTGTRLWPYSRTLAPKQFLNLGNPEESLLQETLERLRPLVQPKDITLIGSEAHQATLLSQTQTWDAGFNPHQILLEPQAKNTAPSILWGLSQIPLTERDQPVAILPADHLIAQRDAFLTALQAGAELAQAGKLVIFGVKPLHPETGYGYLQRGEPFGKGYLVARFVEKPNLERAQAYLAQGDYYWNAGIFMATAQQLLREYQTHSPTLYDAFVQAGFLPQGQGDVKTLFRSLRSESFDYAILEKSPNVAMVELTAGWSDLGSWESLYQLHPKDAQGNVTRGNVLLEDCKNSMVFTGKRLVAGLGLDHLLVVETGDAILVCDLKRSQEVKTLVDRLKKDNAPEPHEPSKLLRPWGYYEVLLQSPGYKIKRIEVAPGKRLSLQRHAHRNEHWVVVEGSAKVTCGEKEFFLSANESTYIPRNQLHRLENPGLLPLRLIEVQQGEYLGEDDIVRISDDYAR